MEIQDGLWSSFKEDMAGHLPDGCHHLKLHMHAEDGEVGKAETRADGWCSWGGSARLSQSSHPVTLVSSLCPHSMASAGKGLAETADKQHGPSARQAAEPRYHRPPAGQAADSAAGRLRTGTPHSYSRNVPCNRSYIKKGGWSFSRAWCLLPLIPALGLHSSPRTAGATKQRNSKTTTKQPKVYHS